MDDCSRLKKAADPVDFAAYIRPYCRKIANCRPFFEYIRSWTTMLVQSAPKLDGKRSCNTEEPFQIGLNWNCLELIHTSVGNTFGESLIYFILLDEFARNLYRMIAFSREG
jgi:hypothetical protein